MTDAPCDVEPRKVRKHAVDSKHKLIRTGDQVTKEGDYSLRAVTGVGIDGGVFLDNDEHIQDASLLTIQDK